MKKIYAKLVGWLYEISIDKYLHFIVGLIVASFFGITLDMAVCIVPVIVVAFAKELFDGMGLGVADWRDFTATVLGGAIIQLFVLL